MSLLRRSGRRTEAGYVAIVIALLLPVVFLGFAALSLDVARWYVVAEKAQKAADAAALAGVVFMPQDLDQATATARDVAKRNGFDDADSDIAVDVSPGARPSQLRVTVGMVVENIFGRFIGGDTTLISRTGLADYTGPAPMGSPCNTFGNEPSAGAGASSPSPKGAGTSALPASPYPNCSRSPQLWAGVEGPETGKLQGDRYGTVNCEDTATIVEFCAAHKNSEYRPEGYFFLVKVRPSAVNTPIDLQLYDPAFVRSNNQQCSALVTADLPSSFDNNMNPYVTTDGKQRYGGTNTVEANRGSGAAVPSFCPGDANPGVGSGVVDAYGTPAHRMTTSFALRQQSDSGDPMSAPVQNGSEGKSCIKQFNGYVNAATQNIPKYAALKKLAAPSNNPSYDDQLAKVFHNWVSLCSFTPTRAGDYYLQVRANVTFGGIKEVNTNGLPPLVSQGNAAVLAAAGDTTLGEGGNQFSIRAVTADGKAVSVSGYQRMPIFENGTASTATFNLIQVLPGAAGQRIEYSFFDVAEATGSGTVKVIPPADATGSITSGGGVPGCTATFGADKTPVAVGSGCTVSVSSANNGRLETMVIPIPTDYDCQFNDISYSPPRPNNGGCWFQVQVNFGGATVNDTTTWDAQLVGDPVRLIE